jgi:antitoxin component YwqK of YwqJK toxin-antitoxin module
MQRISTSFLFFFIFFGITFAQDPVNQLDVNGKKQGYWEKRGPGGKLLYQGNFRDDKPVGEWKRFHENGVVKALINYSESTDTASVQLFDQTGNKIAAGFYWGKEKAGRWSYYDKRQKVSEENYRDGKKNGPVKTYYPTGELFAATNYVDGVEDGTYRAYYKSGTVYFECQMKQGKRDGVCRIFYPNGKPETEAFYKAGVREKDWRYYDETGNLSYTLIYNQGIVTNPAVLDSVEQLGYKELEKNKNKILDPEKFTGDPVEYMMRKGIR